MRKKSKYYKKEGTRYKLDRYDRLFKYNERTRKYEHIGFNLTIDGYHKQFINRGIKDISFKEGRT